MRKMFEGQATEGSILIEFPMKTLEDLKKQMDELIRQGYEPQVIILWKMYCPKEVWQILNKGGAIKVFDLPVFVVNYECAKVY